jgi:mRNA interferase RelE/StbE
MKPILHTLRMPEEIAALIRGMHPELKKKIKAGLKAIMEAPHTGKILRDKLAGLRSMRVSKHTGSSKRRNGKTYRILGKIR